MTLACLRSLERQRVDGVHLRVVLVDDGSTDGTGSAVEREFPDAIVLAGDGTLFWNGGMRRAMQRAREDAPDHVWWINDDTQLDDDALSTLLEAHRQVAASGTPALVAGSVTDPETGELTYGGVERRSRLRPLRFDLVAPAHQPREVETVNGNCVLVPREVLDLVGDLDPAFGHAMGDYDYGLRARRRGATVWLAPGTVGTCARNPDPWEHGDVSEVWQRLRSQKGIPPREWGVFVRRWGGALWPIYWLSPYLRRLARAARRLTSRTRAGSD